MVNYLITSEASASGVQESLAVYNIRGANNLRPKWSGITNYETLRCDTSHYDPSRSCLFSDLQYELRSFSEILPNRHFVEDLTQIGESKSWNVSKANIKAAWIGSYVTVIVSEPQVKVSGVCFLITIELDLAAVEDHGEGGQLIPRVADCEGVYLTRAIVIVSPW